MASPVLNLGAFTSLELTTWLTALKTEVMLRASTGRIKTGGSAAQQYGMDTMSTSDLFALINSITSWLGYDYTDTLRIRPNFNASGSYLPESTTFGA